MEEGSEWEERIGRAEMVRNYILAKSYCTHNRKPAHAVKWCARHEVPRRLPAFLFLLHVTTLLPLLLFPSPPLLTRRVDATVLETVQIKQVKTREGRRRLRERGTGRIKEKEGVTVEGNGGVQHEPFAPCTICCIVASKTLRPGFAGTPYAYCMPRRYYRRLRRFYCFKYRTCRT